MKLAKIDTDDRYNNVEKSTKFQINTDIFDGDMTSSNFDVILNSLRRHNSINRNDVILKLFKFTSRHRAYLLVKFYDDRGSRTC